MSSYSLWARRGRADVRGAAPLLLRERMRGRREGSSGSGKTTLVTTFAVGHVWPVEGESWDFKDELTDVISARPPQ